jgi:hypothetical protein
MPLIDLALAPDFPACVCCTAFVPLALLAGYADVLTPVSLALDMHSSRAAFFVALASFAALIVICVAFLTWIRRAHAGS